MGCGGLQKWVQIGDYAHYNCFVITLPPPSPTWSVQKFSRDVWKALPSHIILINSPPDDSLSPLTMRLDATDLRYVTPEEFRVLQAVRQAT